MPCSHVRIEGSDGQVAHAIICGRRRIRACRKCGGISTRECDWKLPNGKTCDCPLCERCSTKPAPEKDLCPVHAEQWGERLAVEFGGLRCV